MSKSKTYVYYLKPDIDPLNPPSDYHDTDEEDNGSDISLPYDHHAIISDHEHYNYDTDDLEWRRERSRNRYMTAAKLTKAALAQAKKGLTDDEIIESIRKKHKDITKLFPDENSGIDDEEWVEYIITRYVNHATKDGIYTKVAKSEVDQIIKKEKKAAKPKAKPKNTPETKKKVIGRLTKNKKSQATTTKSSRRK